MSWRSMGMRAGLLTGVLLLCVLFGRTLHNSLEEKVQKQQLVSELDRTKRQLRRASAQSNGLKEELAQTELYKDKSQKQTQQELADLRRNVSEAENLQTKLERNIRELWQKNTILEQENATLKEQLKEIPLPWPTPGVRFGPGLPAPETSKQESPEEATKPQSPDSLQRKKRRH